jgi:anti-sigma factor RsiW
VKPDDPTAEADLIRMRDAGPAGPAADPALAALGAEWDRQDAALRALYAPVAGEPLPEPMRAALRAAAARTASSRRSGLWRIAAALALVGFGGAGGFLLARAPVAGGGDAQIATEAFRAHATYVVEMRHPVEVTAAEPEHLAAWLSKRLDRAITPPDLGALGYRLMGGRVLPGRDGTAALMMYEDDRGGRLTLYVVPRPDAGEGALRFAEAGTTRGAWWTDRSIGCAVIGEIDREALRAIANSAYEQLI